MRKEFSLKKSSDFRKVFKEGRKISSPHFVLYANNNALPQSRIGILILKSHFKLATRRNRLRRIAKELFRKEVCPHLEGCDLVIASRANFPHSNINEAIKELKGLLSKVKS